ncbi:MAG: methyltransferase RsmF C-terminal domain-like protein [Bacteroidales bacterium]
MILPKDFIKQTIDILGEDQFRDFETGLNEEAPVSIRINGKKASFDELSYLPIAEKVKWSDTGFYLRERPSFTFDPLFHAGCYYVQEASSMFIEQAIRTYANRPLTYLDLCAAPGGKTTLAYSLLPEGSMVVCNEIMRNRSNILAENMTKWGADRVIVTNNSSEDYSVLTHTFDVILTDVPCSGEGMFRKDPVAIEEWSADNVDMCAVRQRGIIDQIWQTLKPGGLLIYSTCTYNTAENEENVHYIAETYGAEVLPVNTDNYPEVTGGLTYDYPVYRFMPHKTKGEGFFMAVLRKPDDEICMPYKLKEKKGKSKKSSKDVIIKTPDYLYDWLLHKNDFEIVTVNESFIAIPKSYIDLYRAIQANLKIVKAGIDIAQQKGKDMIPDHALALSPELNREMFIEEEVSEEKAIQYLRKEAIALNDETPRGYVLITYKSKPLGWMKNIGNRANNLYPQEWRIRSQVK